MAKRTLVLLVISGWGVGEANNSNPIFRADPPNMNYIRLNYPAGTLQASGIAVGLPWNEEGNPEVGYLTLGAGKVLYQDYPRVSLAIRDGSFNKNKELLGVIEHAKTNKGKVNLVGMIGDGTSHSVFEHLDALIKLSESNGVDYALHLFTDGKDSPSQSAARLLTRVPNEKIASISGRHFAMDRDLHWEKTRRVYDTITGNASVVDTGGQNVSAFMSTFYARNLTDDFVAPMLVKRGGEIAAGDGVVFFNLREDSMSQLVQMFVDPKVGNAGDISLGQRVEDHKILENLRIVTLTNYGERFNLPVAFPQERVVNPLGKVLSDNGKIQLKIAETEKYIYVTNFFNGMSESTLPNEYRVLIPSRSEAKVEEHPEMRVKEISSRALSALGEGIYDFIFVDFTNADTIAHTGNFDAALTAIKAIDTEVGSLMKAVLGAGGVMVVTSDHGNIEEMMDVRTGLRATANNTSPVPFYVVANGYERQKTEAQAREIEKLNTGVLSDVAPTILHLMGIPKPQDMTGISLLSMLR